MSLFRSALVIDVIINTEFYREYVAHNDLYQTVVATFALEIVEAKFESRPDFPVVGWKLRKNEWTKLANKRRQVPIRSAQKPQQPPLGSASKTPPQSVIDEINRLVNGPPLKNVKMHDYDDEKKNGVEHLVPVSTSHVKAKDLSRITKASSNQV